MRLDRFSAILLAAAACVAIAVPVRAAPPISELPTGRTMVMPDIGGPRLPAASQAVAPAPAPAVPARPGPGETMLRTLAGPSATPEVVGETGVLSWDLVLTPRQASAGRAVQVAYRTAVSLLPERSSLTLTVNGRQVGSVRLFSPSVDALTRFDLPTGLLQSGRNRVTLTLSQRHRVDCTVPATFELWTRLDMAKSGLIMPAGTPGPDDLADIGALPAAPDGSMPLRLAMPGRLKPAGVGGLMGLVQAVALAVPDTPVLTDFGPLADGPAGLNLALGPASELQAQGLALGETTPGSVQLLPAQPDRRATLAVVAESPADLDQALRKLALLAGQPSLREGPLLSGGERIRLSELGFSDVSFGGRVYRSGLTIRMPGDLLPADYGSLRLELDGAYAAGLAPGAQIRVEVNGRAVASAPLTRSGGETLRAWPIHLPVGVFRPGENRIEIIANLPEPTDEACNTATLGAERPRLLLLATSTLVVPSLARVRRAPELAQFAGGGLPFSTDRSAWLHVPAPDRDTMAAAGTLVARLALAAGRPTAFRFTTAAPPSEEEDRLVVGDAATLQAVSRHPVAVRWRREAVAQAAPVAAKPALELAPAGDSPPTWAASWPGVAPSSKRSWTEAIGNAVSATGQAAVERFDAGVAAWFDRGDAPPSFSTLVALQELGDSGAGSTTLFAGETPASLRKAAEDLVLSGTWDALGGTLSRVDGKFVTASGSPRLFAFPPGTRSPANVRLVVAGWLSLNPGVFSGGAGGLALLIALATRALLNRVGRRTS
ncbi:MAG: cellulose biosynthesis cyclic di-GMP-binding regulatory protein BcsB [Alsobacter sp.]